MSGLNEGTTVLSEDRWGEPTVRQRARDRVSHHQNQRKGANVYGALEYRFSADNLAWFADFQLGRQTVKLLTGTNGNDVASDHMGWEFHDPNSTDNNDKIFFNANTGHYESGRGSSRRRKSAASKTA
jgi:iron complex outermembrane receptor protein